MGARWEPVEEGSLRLTRKDLHPKWQHDEYEWLCWESHSRGIKVQHQLNGGQVKIGHYHTDGFAVDSVSGKQLVFEFNGCW